MEHEHAASLTARAVKKAVPDRAILTRDARKTINSAASVFTLYLASIAHETSVANKRSTITLNDVLQTLRDADFEHFIEPIEACLQGERRFGKESVCAFFLLDLAIAEAKAEETRKKNQKMIAEEEEGAETTSEVAEQLDEVAIDTNEEDADEDEDMMSADEPLDADGDENTEVKGMEDDGSAEVMESS
ncbi:hypothetical protein DD237_003343 [Peronospora effusa]|uniref:Transcription factor CBF/NF-Y/archaeal histone domain-containing protein n=1 Tax=Peronospora effusa TaxID=542832 RepID=A0A425CD56_9STRA|nr:hypothetical protein DD237_003343 [Peronospora effusa]